MHISRALASVHSLWSVHVILLSKMTPRQFTLLTKAMFLTFGCNKYSGTLNLLRNGSPEISFHWSLCSRVHTTKSLFSFSLQFTENTTFVFLCCANRGIVREQSKMNPNYRGASFIYRLYNIGVKMEPWDTPVANILGAENSSSTKTLKFILMREK
jgi:hypothetical protein